jgi:hypothetical protein
MDCNRDGMSPAESIPYTNLSEVHPGADSVRDNLAESGNSRYLNKMYAVCNSTI